MLETLHCKIGDHDFERERKRGVKPRNCPEHKPVVESSGRGRGANIEAMHEGRRKAAAERARQGIITVRAFQKWSKADAAAWLAYQAGDMTRKEYKEAQPDPVPLPTAADWAAARQAGVVSA